MHVELQRQICPQELCSERHTNDMSKYTDVFRLSKIIIRSFLLADTSNVTIQES
jgi:hypothetical protein